MEFWSAPLEEGSYCFLPIFASLINSNEYSTLCWTFLSLLFFLSNYILWNWLGYFGKNFFLLFVQKSDKLKL